MFSDLKSTIKTLGLTLAILTVVGYAFFEARGVIAGPIIEVTEPKNGKSFHESLITIKGYTRNISFISLNDNPITVDEEGNFIEKLLLSPGYNIIKLKVVDRFGREKVSFLELLFKMES
ncbi:MAG: Xre-like protein DNA-binding protein [Parcubacteria group bacterium Gr01-1014_107]|nr:MAG: Xre-like protein DNA-binding protein [Parcubacteria group bacterium Gr01-1014_107]